MIGPTLEPSDLEAFETVVVPRYLAFFGNPALEALTPVEGMDPRVALVGCRSGYPARELASRMPNARFVGLDPSPSAIEAAERGAPSGWQFQIGSSPMELDAQQYSHAIAIHPLCPPPQRGRFFDELARLLKPGGQLVVSMPVRNAFIELLDLLREFALKQDLSELGEAVEVAARSRPTLEMLDGEIARAGFEDIEMDVRLENVTFAGGRAFWDDPVARLFVLPAAWSSLPIDHARGQAARRYVGDAVVRYWSEIPFDLTLNIACVSATRR